VPICGPTRWVVAGRGHPGGACGHPAAALDRPADAPEVRAAQAVAMAVDPIRSILAAQHPAGWWTKPGPGYGPKYRGTLWQVIFLDQLGADPRPSPGRPRLRVGAGLVPTASGGFGCSAAKQEQPPPPSAVIHGLNGNLLRALIGFGRLEDPRVQAAIGWAARAITGEGVDRWYASGTSGPGFAGAADQHQPCAWGALKELNACPGSRPSDARRWYGGPWPQGWSSCSRGTRRSPTTPMGWGNTKPSASWFKPGFPSGYVADVLQTLEVLAELGHGRDHRLGHALAWLESAQNRQGRWSNRYAYNHKTWVDIEPQGQPSKWVTLRACTVLRAAYR
jgi:hypothetical protein